MSARSNVPAQLTQALHEHAPRLALTDHALSLTYGQLAALTVRLQPHMPTDAPVAVFGKPSTLFGAAAAACVISGRPFVHLDPAMPREVLRNILEELAIATVFVAEPPAEGQLPEGITPVEVSALAADLPDDATPIEAPDVADDAAIYIVATSGTTGKPKCIPVTQRSAFLSYEWRDAYTPYGPEDRVGAYIFAIWEMFRPLRRGARVTFARFNELMNPADLVRFWQRTGVTEMLFTPSALEKALRALPAGPIPGVALQRIILNGEVVNDDLIAAVAEKLPGVSLWNLYSICETHDISITDVTARGAVDGAVSVGVPMPHLRAVVLDDADAVCGPGQPGLLHFEGTEMLGPGYVNRPEETALRFRNLTLEGRERRLYDTGDQGYVGADGAVYVIGRIAHMLKLRGHSIQTRELTESLRGYIGFGQAVPWIKEVEGQGKVLVLYYTSDAAQQAQNRADWGLDTGQMRMPAALSKAMRAVLPAYCVPAYLVRLDEMPINAVSGKTDYKRLPDITPQEAEQSDVSAVPTVVEAARVMGCAVGELDAALSFHAQGGDSLMAVTYLLALEEIYARPVDFDFALNVALGRLHELLSDTAQTGVTRADFTRKGVLLTGATGFLGSRLLAAAARDLPEDHVVYCVIREKRNAPTDRMQRVAEAQGVDPDRLVLISASIEDAQFGLDAESYGALTDCVTRVIHCAAMVNLAVDRSHSEAWSQAGISNVIRLCQDAGAELRFTSSSAVFPDTGGPFAEAPAVLFDGCSGYGAAKIDAEAQIADAGIAAAIVRLPSLYDLAEPNAKDIYEIIMAACQRCGAVPEGLMFRMVDANAVARFLTGLPSREGVHYYNFAPDTWLRLSDLPKGYDALPQDEWLEAAPLSPAERNLIAADPTVLHADSRFEHAGADAAWQAMSGEPLSAISDAPALAAARFTSSLPR
ncbi:AMP-binding protein [Gymnodinialimonas ceratoperidinii]|uniref:AMP-binding protein n=1 Tax=Gymnodinialimonas ceratoperidinii TaxID=2856823 RepID=A0A8F6TTF2_9RHOB|nr:AMP-binding protein [Gymnodinialimonas ceratoperidinii]QXT38158.1 AMP-binding protein [Gymnodinialimonas ceratoperidinii]